MSDTRADLIDIQNEWNEKEKKENQSNPMAHSKLDKTVDDLLYDYWAKHRDCENGCQSPTDHDGAGTKQALLEAFEQSLPGEYQIRDTEDPQSKAAKDGYNAYRNEAIKVIRGEE